MQINSARRRRAISPVLATVILIAITLIAAIAIAGFVFGLFGSFTSTARVSVISTALVHNAATPFMTGSINVQNIGTSNTNANSMTVTYGGVTCAPQINAGNPQLVTAGVASVTVSLTAVGSCTVATVAGEAFTGSLALSNGGQVPFSGVFS